MKDIISNLNKNFESRVRMGIMSVLMVNDYVDFITLKELLDITDGNLSSHISALEKNNLIKVTKQFIGKKPNTRYEATEIGCKAFKEHLDFLDRLLKSQKEK
ncbi:MAG: transcriptional regulator [Bacteroidales bacterium]